MTRIVRIDPARSGEPEGLEEIARALSTARRPVALTGAGISVESGIPDFRSPGGLWSVFDPMEYATLSCFRADPEKAWRLYRALAETIEGSSPNPAHLALARLEAAGHLAGVITQNIDGLHEAAGSRTVVEMHGEHRHLQCLACGRIEPARPEQFRPGPLPRCPACARALKPNVVLFEEMVRGIDEIDGLLDGCDLLLVAGTSAEVHPASSLPGRVLDGGGSVIEFNIEPTRLTSLGHGPRGAFVEGPVGKTLPLVADGVVGGS